MNRIVEQISTQLFDIVNEKNFATFLLVNVKTKKQSFQVGEVARAGNETSI
jgi:hypothetical protein